MKLQQVTGEPVGLLGWLVLRWGQEARSVGAGPWLRLQVPSPGEPGVLVGVGSSGPQRAGVSPLL